MGCGWNLNIGKDAKFDLTQVATQGVVKTTEMDTLVFNIFDKNQDGTLSKEELANMASIFQKAAGSDNMLSKSEFEGLSAELNNEIKNKDGKITAKQLRKFIKEIGAENANRKSMISTDAINEEVAENKVKAEADAQAASEAKAEADDKAEAEAEAKVKADAKAKAEARIMAEAEAEAKANKHETSDYVVPKGKNYTTLIKESLKAQDIEITSENIQAAKERFEQNNPGAVHKNKNGVEYLYAGAKIQVEGGLKSTSTATVASSATQKTHSGSAQDSSETASRSAQKAKKTYYPNGKLKTEVVNNENGTKTTFYYDENGTMTKQVYLHNGKSDVIEPYSTGYIKKASYYDNEGKLCINEYYPNGKLKTKVVNNENGTKKTFYYDKHGTMTTFYYDKNGTKTKKVYLYNGKLGITEYYSNGKPKKAFYYNDKGKLVNEFFREDGSLAKKITHDNLLDKNGKPVEVLYKQDGKATQMKYSDSKGIQHVVYFK